MSVAKVIELMGSSEKSFDEALDQVITRAGKSLRHLRGVEIVSKNIKLGENGTREYRVNVKVVFRLED